MTPNVLGSEKIGLPGVAGPIVVNTAAPLSSNVVPVKNHEIITITVLAGAVAAAEPITVTAVQGVTSAMTGAKNLRVETMAADASNTQLRFSVRQEQFDKQGLFDHLRIDVVHDNATGGPIAVVVDGHDGRVEPQNRYNVSSATAVVP